MKYVRVTWTSLMEEAIDRLADAEHRLGHYPQAPTALLQELRQSQEEAQSALARARDAMENAEGEAKREQETVRREVEIETNVIRDQFDQERHELRAALDAEREHHDVELAAALRRHAAAMELERSQAVEHAVLQANRFLKRQRGDAESAILAALDDLGAIEPTRLPFGVGGLVSGGDLEGLARAKTRLEEALRSAAAQEVEVTPSDLSAGAS